MLPSTPYLLSLPERLVRSASALAGGLLRQAGGVALPAAFRRTRLYENLVEATLRFMIENMGQVEGVYPSADKLADDFLVRRSVGNGLELVGILAFRASPVWVFAALADVSGTGRQLIADIAESLKQEGLLDPEARFETMDQLLNGLERSSAQLAATFNAPPLDVAGLRAEWTAIRESAASIPAPRRPTAAQLRTRWQRLRDEARTQNRGVFEVSSVLALSAVRRLPASAVWLSRCGRHAARRTGVLFAQTLLDHYDQTLTGMRTQGFGAYWREEFRPYLAGAASQFSRERLTITERWLARP